MSSFAENLACLPAIDHLAALDLLEGGQTIATIRNQPGQAGSLRVYHALYQMFGSIDRQAADHGLHLYAEHSDDARLHPGKHPNIDRLLTIAAPLEVRLIPV
jgi:hypothetical protein